MDLPLGSLPGLRIIGPVELCVPVQGDTSMHVLDYVNIVELFEPATGSIIQYCLILGMFQ